MGYYPSLNERKQRIIENACDSCGGGGDDGAAASSGDDGGIENDNDQLVKGLRLLRKNKKKKLPVIEAKMEKPTMNMRLKASDLDMKVDKEADKEKKMKLIDRARKIRQELD